jgi:hypothetical protein
MRVKITKYGLVLAVAAAVLAVPTPSYAACPTRGDDYPVLTGVLQVNGAPASGVRLVASGTGFRSGSLICVDVASAPDQLAVATATRSGNFITTITLPDLAPGQHILRATGIARSGSTLILNTAFTNGYALPSTGTRLLRWLGLGAALVGLILLLVRPVRRARARNRA